MTVRERISFVYLIRAPPEHLGHENLLVPPPVSFYLDTNALRYLFRFPGLSESEQVRVRARVAELTGRRRIAAVSSVAAFQELGSLAATDRARYLEVLRVAEQVTGPRVVFDAARIDVRSRLQPQPWRRIARKPRRAA